MAREEKKPARTVEVSPWLLGALVFGILLLAFFLWSNTHVRPARVTVEPYGDFHDYLPSIAGLTRGPIIEGNAVRVIQDREFYAVLLEEIGAARETVHFESYVWWTGEICHRLGEAFAAKAREGVEVRLMLDALGSSRMDDEILEELAEAGVIVQKYNPVRWKDLGRLNRRDHRKIAVIDGRVGYLFGHGVALDWTDEAKEHPPWRDTAVRLEGPIVGAVQSVFAENWLEQTGEVLLGEKYFPELEEAGTVDAHIAASSPSGDVSAVLLLYKVAIATAQEEILIQNPYFVPDEDIVHLLTAKAREGVKVRLMIPGDPTDSNLVRHAAHVYFEPLLEAGVEVYLYQRTLLHQKVMVIDGVWSHVGSTNFDNRSFEINDEVSLGMIDEGVAGQLAAAFERDLQHCDRLQKEGWDPSAPHRLMDRAAFLFKEQI